MRSLIAVLTFLLSASVSQAATFSPDPSPLCFFKLEGPIVQGDFEKFEAAAKQYLPEVFSEGMPNNRMCLNSPGGSLAEAVKIGRVMHEIGVGSVVLGGDSCLSACTTLFMMGTMAGFEAGGTNRVLHINGTLGFHRPSLALPEGNYDNDTVIKAFGLALDATAGFVEMANQVPRYSRTPMIQADLIREMYTHEGEDYFYINKVDHAGRWGIRVVGFTPPQTFGAEEAFHACNNLGAWPARLLGTDFAFKPDQVKVSQHNTIGKVFSVFGSLQSDGIHSCMVRVPTPQRPFLEICGRSDTTDVNINNVSCSAFDLEGDNTPIFARFGMERAIYPANTLLRDLPKVARQIEARATPPSRPKDSDNGFRAQCGYVQGTNAYIANVNNFVNVRQSVGFKAGIAGEARRDAKVTIVGEGTSIFGDGRVKVRCRQVCFEIAQNNRSASALRQLNQCYEDNALWFQVRSGNLQGYVSGKFLRF